MILPDKQSHVRVRLKADSGGGWRISGVFSEVNYTTIFWRIARTINSPETANSENIKRFKSFVQKTLNLTSSDPHPPNIFPASLFFACLMHSHPRVLVLRLLPILGMSLVNDISSIGINLGTRTLDTQSLAARDPWLYSIQLKRVLVSEPYLSSFTI